MTEPVRRRSLLLGVIAPPERVIEAADAAIEDLDTAAVRRAGGPDISAVPVDYLPARAWGRSVDVWDPVWPEAVRRGVIQTAPAVHRVKGSVASVEMALAALTVEATITEWWQSVPRRQPYTFTVRAYSRGALYGGPPLDLRTIRIVYATVMRTKPLSRAFDLEIGADVTGKLGIGGRIRPRFRIAVASVPALPPG